MKLLPGSQEVESTGSGALNVCRSQIPTALSYFLVCVWRGILHIEIFH